MDQPEKKETSQIYINLTRFFLNKPIYFFSCIETLLKKYKKSKITYRKKYMVETSPFTTFRKPPDNFIGEQRSAVPHTHRLPMHETANASHRFHHQ